MLLRHARCPLRAPLPAQALLLLHELFSSISRQHLRVPKAFQSTTSQDPLRLLFCGSDAYSIACLKALHAEHLATPETIQSIDVVCRPGKPVGRGYKEIRHPPIRAAAKELSLPIHELDTFTGWTPPSFEVPPHSINLIVAVSFGLFVPPRLLQAAKYGGINVHPSMLPDLRGAAPLHWALIERDTHIGVTVQTLHPQRWDHGSILRQTERPGLRIPPNANHSDLLDLVMPESTKLLTEVIQERGFHQERSTPPPSLGSYNLRLAPKIKPEHRRVSWKAWSATDFMTRQRVLGRLWTTLNSARESVRIASMPEQSSLKSTRIILGDDCEIVPNDSPMYGQFVQPDIPIGTAYAVVKTDKPSTSQSALFVNTSDHATIMLRTMTVEGSKARRAFDAAIAHNLMTAHEQTHNTRLFVFRQSFD